MNTEYRVLKYEWKSNSEPVMMPKGARILSIQVQPQRNTASLWQETVQMWVIADYHAYMVKRKIQSWGTGYQLPNGDPGKFLGTVQMNRGSFVLHFFDLGEDDPI